MPSTNNFDWGRSGPTLTNLFLIRLAAMTVALTFLTKIAINESESPV